MPAETKLFHKLMYLATKGNFVFNEKLYEQVDGVIIGNPFGPTLGYFFLDIKKRYLQIWITTVVCYRKLI